MNVDERPTPSLFLIGQLRSRSIVFSYSLDEQRSDAYSNATLSPPSTPLSHNYHRPSSTRCANWTQVLLKIHTYTLWYWGGHIRPWVAYVQGFSCWYEKCTKLSQDLPEGVKSLIWYAPTAYIDACMISYRAILAWGEYVIKIHLFFLTLQIVYNRVRT